MENDIHSKDVPPWCRVHSEKIDRMEKTLYGNGREGIEVKVNRIEILLKAALIFAIPISIGAVGVIVDRIIHLI